MSYRLDYWLLILDYWSEGRTIVKPGPWWQSNYDNILWTRQWIRVVCVKVTFHRICRYSRYRLNTRASRVLHTVITVIILLRYRLRNSNVWHKHVRLTHSNVLIVFLSWRKNFFFLLNEIYFRWFFYLPNMRSSTWYILGGVLILCIYMACIHHE